ncbi:hypothetical protein QTP86_028839, partial [Hemibagrus guttatus]
MLAYKAKNGPAPSYLKALVTSRTAPRLLRSTSTARLVPPSLREKGLENMYIMTNMEKYQLRVDMEDFEKGSAYAQYTMFTVSQESTNYILNIGGFISGGA